jgi:hypothetical protein
VAFLVLDKDTGEEPHHVGSMEKNVGFLERHALVKSPSEMVSPDSVLPAHVFLFAILLFLATKQQALCRPQLANAHTNTAVEARTGCDLLILKINKFLEPKHHNIRRVLWLDGISDEIRRAQATRG